MKIATSKTEWEQSPLSFNGYIEKRLKRAVHLTVNETTYTVNTHGVLCKRSILSDGRTWYSFPSSDEELFSSQRESHAFSESLSTGPAASG